MTSDIVKLQQSDTIGKELQVIGNFIFLFDVVDYREVKLGSGRDTLYLTGIGNGFYSVDGVFPFYLAYVGIGVQLVEVAEALLGELDVAELEAGGR